MTRFRTTTLAAAATIPALAMLFAHGTSRQPYPQEAEAAATFTVDSIASPAGPGSAQPNMTVDQNGRVYLSWLQPADTGHTLRFSVYDGTRWSTPTTIVARRDFFVNWADFPALQILDGGRMAAHWLQRTGTGTYAYGVRVSQSRDAGRSWSAPVTPHRDTSHTEHGFVAMWREPGRLGVVWLDGQNFSNVGRTATNQMMLLSTTIAPDGTLGAESRLDQLTCDCCQNSAAMTSQGPIVAYRDRSPQEIRDIYVTRRVNGAWTAGAPVHSDNWRINACPVNGPAVAARENRVALAWFTAADESAQVKVAFSDNAGVRFSAPVRVDGGSPTGRVDVALLADGAALVTWIERIGADSAAVMARRISREGRAGAPFTIAASSAARASGFPRMAVSGDYAMFAWTQPGRPSAVRVSRVLTSAIR